MFVVALKPERSYSCNIHKDKIPSIPGCSMYRVLSIHKQWTLPIAY